MRSFVPETQGLDTFEHSPAVLGMLGPANLSTHLTDRFAQSESRAQAAEQTTREALRRTGSISLQRCRIVLSIIDVAKTLDSKDGQLCVGGFPTSLFRRLIAPGSFGERRSFRWFEQFARSVRPDKRAKSLTRLDSVKGNEKHNASAFHLHGHNCGLGYGNVESGVKPQLSS